MWIHRNKLIIIIINILRTLFQIHFFEYNFSMYYPKLRIDFIFTFCRKIRIFAQSLCISHIVINVERYFY